MEFFALISAVVGLASLFINARKNESDQAYQQQSQELAEKQVETQTDISNQNFALSKEQFEYQKQLNELQMQREDTAVQRQVADLKKAGLSPLMVSGGSSTGQLISAQAPQYDSSGILQAMSNLLGVRNDYAGRKQLAYQFERQQGLQVAQQVADLYSLRLDNQYKQRQIEAMDIANAYNLEHGLRDPSIQNYLVDAFETWLKNHETSLPDKVDEAIDKAKGYVKDEAKDIPEKLGELYIDPVKHAIETDIRVSKNAYNSFKDTLSSGYNYLKSKAKYARNYVKNKFRRKK